MSHPKLALLGGDKRIGHMAPFLKEMGFFPICYGVPETETARNSSGIKTVYAGSMKEAVDGAAGVICGIPLTRDGIHLNGPELDDMTCAGLADCLSPRQKLFAGVIPDGLKCRLIRKKVAVYDFMQVESIALYNTIATAEGAILEALLHQDTNLHGSRALVLGYGRCAAVLAQKLSALSVRVTVCARREEALARAEAFGLDTLPLTKLPEALSAYEYIFNTIPAPVIGAEILEQMREDALILELAPGKNAIDPETAHRLRRRVIECPGLPGRYAPRASARKLAEYVAEKIAEPHPCLADSK